jgi:hypothetical protein
MLAAPPATYKNETAFGKDLLNKSVLRNLRAGGYASHSANARLKDSGKLWSFYEGGERKEKSGDQQQQTNADWIKLETHGLVSFSQGGECAIPSRALQDANQTKAAVSKAFKFVDLVKRTCTDFEDFTKLELELTASTLSHKVAEAKLQQALPLHESFEAEKSLILLLHSKGAKAKQHVNEERYGEALRDLGRALESAIETLDGGPKGYKKAISDPWKKLVSDTLSFELHMNQVHDYMQGIQAELHKLNLNRQDSKRGIAEYLARKQQLDEKEESVTLEVHKFLQETFPPLMQSWALFLSQTYYQHLLDKAYQKNQGYLSDLLEKLSNGDNAEALTPEEKDRLTGHWQEQLKDVTAFLTVWQKEFTDSSKKVDFLEQKKQINALKDAFKVWIKQDLDHWVQVVYAQKLAGQLGENFTKAYIVEIDSDDSESESGADDDEEEEIEEIGGESATDASTGGGNKALLPEGFSVLSKHREALEGTVKVEEKKFNSTIGAYDRARLKMHQLGLACVVDCLYFGKLADLFFVSDADRVMREMLQLEDAKMEAKQQKMKKNKRKQEEALKRESEQIQANQKEKEKKEKEEEEVETEFEVEIDDQFESQNNFSVLGSNPPANLRKTKLEAGTTKANPQQQQQQQQKGKNTKKNKNKKKDNNTTGSKEFQNGEAPMNAVEMRMRGLNRPTNASSSKRQGKPNHPAGPTASSKGSSRSKSRSNVNTLSGSENSNGKENRPLQQQPKVTAARGGQTSRSNVKVDMPKRLNKAFLTEAEVQEKLHYQIVGHEPNVNNKQEEENRLKEFPALPVDIQNTNIIEQEPAYAQQPVYEQQQPAYANTNNGVQQQQQQQQENTRLAILQQIEACEKIYLNAKSRAEKVYERITSNSEEAPSPEQMMRHRYNVLQFIFEDAKAELAHVELEVAMNIATNGSSLEWREQQTQRLRNAHDKAEKAQRQVEAFNQFAQ